MAVPRRARATVLATQKPSGVTKQTGVRRLAVQKQQQQQQQKKWQQKGIQRFGRISKLATRVGKAIEEDLITASSLSVDAKHGVERKRKVDCVGEEKDRNDGDDEENGMIRSTAALKIEMSSEMMLSSPPSRLQNRERFSAGEGEEQTQSQTQTQKPTQKPTQQLRSVLVTEQKKAQLSQHSQPGAAKQELRKRKRVTFDNDENDENDDELNGISVSSLAIDATTRNSTLSSRSSTRKTLTSEAIYRAGISESAHSSQSPSKRPRNALLSSTRLLAGQLRLDDIKTDAASAREKASRIDKALPKAFSICEERQKLEGEKNEAMNPEESTANDIKSPKLERNYDVSTRNQSLLDRILAKQQWLAALPQAPTKAERERRAALHRVEEVVAVLTLLAGRNRASEFGGLGGGIGEAGSVNRRASFPLQVLVKNVQGSVRSPMASEEVLKCLEVLEEEIGPAGFVKVLRTGGVCAVVICPRLRPAVGDLRKRVEEALAVEGKV